MLVLFWTDIVAAQHTPKYFFVCVKVCKASNKTSRSGFSAVVYNTFSLFWRLSGTFLNNFSPAYQPSDNLIKFLRSLEFRSQKKWFWKTKRNCSGEGGGVSKELFYTIGFEICIAFKIIYVKKINNKQLKYSMQHIRLSHHHHHINPNSSVNISAKRYFFFHSKSNIKNKLTKFVFFLFSSFSS